MESSENSGPLLGETILPPMSFRTPQGLHAVPLPLHEGERAAAVAALVREIFPKGDEEFWQSMTAVYGAVASELVAVGVAFTGMGLYDLGDGQIGHCSLSVAAVESDHPDAEVAALGIREMYARMPMRDVSWLDLPCGPAVSVISFRNLVIDGSFTASGEDAQVTTGQIQVYIPFPADPYTAVFTMDTAAADNWDDFSTLMGEIVQSVEFPPVSADSTPQETPEEQESA